MAGKRVKRSEKVEEKNIQTITQEATMEQETIINEILQIENTIWTQEDLQDLPKSKLNKILEAEEARAEAKAENIALKASKGRKKNETTKSPFSKRARIVQRFLEDTKSAHHMIMKHLIDNPHTSGKEINDKFRIKYGQTCVHHTRVLLNVLYNNNLLSQECIDKINTIMAETE